MGLVLDTHDGEDLCQVVVTSLGAENRSTSRVPAHGTGCGSPAPRGQHAIAAEVGQRGGVRLGYHHASQPAAAVTWWSSPRSWHLHAALVGEAVVAGAREVDEVTRAASGLEDGDGLTIGHAPILVA